MARVVARPAGVRRRQLPPEREAAGAFGSSARADPGERERDDESGADRCSSQGVEHGHQAGGLAVKSQSGTAQDTSSRHPRRV